MKKSNGIIYFILFLSGVISAQNFAFMGGNDGPYSNGVYGTQGVPSGNNVVSSRAYGVSWFGKTGNVWHFGGYGYTTSGITRGGLNDLWRKSPSAFTWMKGSTTLNQPANYGVKGVGSAANTPGSNYNCSSSIDTAGNLWLFSVGVLWKYTIATNQWIWMSGNNSGTNGVYGTIGISGPLNEPGPRSSSVMWHDNADNLWLFGGSGYGASGTTNGNLNDLWKYSIASNEWTWVSGSSSINQNGIYGTIGVANTANTPGGRGSCVKWADKAGNLWLFGGSGFPGTGTVTGTLNDLWRYNIANNQWTWMKGSNLINSNGTYGTITIPAAGNCPGARSSAGSWADSLGNGWVFGGGGFAASGSGSLLNDLWRYDVTSNTWTWMKGSNATEQNSIEGTYGVPAPANIPSARVGINCWTDKNGVLWMFGGYGDGSSNVITYRNSYWKYVVCYPVSLTASSQLNICTEQSASLTVNGNAAASWYNTASGGTALFSGSVFVSPTLTSTATYYVENPSCPSGAGRAQITVTVSECTGIATNNKKPNDISIYPNPGFGEFVIELTDKNYLTVMDVYGKIILKKELEHGQHLIDLKNKEDGIYFFQIEGRTPQRTFKVLKN